MPSSGHERAAKAGDHGHTDHSEAIADHHARDLPREDSRLLQPAALRQPEQLLTAGPDQVPEALRGLDELSATALPFLRQHFAGQTAESSQKLHAAYGLARFGEAPQAFLLESVPRVNTHEAKSQLSKLIAAVRDGEEVVICQAGKPVARLTAFEDKPRVPLLGIWEGKVKFQPGWDSPETDAEIMAMFDVLKESDDH